jgi:hypothetical protein
MKAGMSAFGTKRTCRFALHMSAFDPKRTLLSLSYSMRTRRSTKTVVSIATAIFRLRVLALAR